MTNNPSADEAASPIASVIIPTKNRAESVIRAIRSVCKQTLSEIEIIVVDDGSTDATPELLAEEAARLPHLHVIRHEVSRGGAGARNSGILAAKGGFVAFLDDDDEWLEEKLEAQIELLERHPKSVACNCGYFHRVSNLYQVRRMMDSADNVASMFDDNHYGGASTCLVRTEVIKQIGGFDDTLPSQQDWDLWVRLVQHGPIETCQRYLVHYDARGAVRISTNHRARYRGFRIFYAKHKHLVPEQWRAGLIVRTWVARFLSRRPRSPKAWLRCVLLVLKYVGPRSRKSYLKSLMLS